MTVGELLRYLNGVDKNLTIEVATSPRKDEWYQVYDVEADRNHRDELVIVINTD